MFLEYLKSHNISFSNTLKNDLYEIIEYFLDLETIKEYEQMIADGPLKSYTMEEVGKELGFEYDI